jgi:hypothetical protein
MSQDPSILIKTLGAPFFTAPNGTVVRNRGGVPVDLTGIPITVAPNRSGSEASILLSDATTPALGPNQLLITGLRNITLDDIGKAFLIANASVIQGFNPDPPPAPPFATVADNNGIFVVIARGTGFATETESVIVERTGPAPVRATDVLTGTGNFAGGETVTLGDKTYLFEAVLTDVDGNVQLGGDLATSLANLFDAINLTGTPGTQYAASMTINTFAFASAVDATTLTAAARLTGFGGNVLAATTTGAMASWATPTLAGGTGVAVFAPDPNNGSIQWILYDAADFPEGDPLKALAERAAPLQINAIEGPAEFADYTAEQPPLLINNAGGVFSRVQKS